MHLRGESFLFLIVYDCRCFFNVDSPDKKDFLYPNREIIVLQQQDKKLQ